MSEDKGNFLTNKLASIRRAAEERDAKRRAGKLNIPYVDLSKMPVSIEAVRLISEEDARVSRVAAIQLRVRELALAVFDPTEPEAKKIIAQLETEKYVVKPFITSLSGLTQVWHFYTFISKDVHEITGAVEIGKKRIEELLQKLSTFQLVHEELAALDFVKTTTTAFLEVILAGALGNRVSDIHFEAEEKHSKIRFRIDGILHDIFNTVPLKNYASLVSRIKLLSGLKMNVHGEPQDGRFTVKLMQKEIEMRISIIPSEFGETIVMRVLDPDAINVTIEQLGLRPDDYKLVEDELKKPHGLILNTGPTGSGKTTTLYAFLRRMVSPEIKIITVEDPIEYRIEGIEQTQVNSDVGYTFAGGLRAIVRQDPDVILVGEIRDLETADIALQAALTGHMVFSTLHANDAVGAVPRFIDIGVKPASIGPALSLVIAQRLVRKLCDTCKKEKVLEEDIKKKIAEFLKKLPERVDRAPYETLTVFEPVGCEVCNSFGYKGRRGVFEFLHGGPEMEQLILKDSSEVALRRLAVSQGMVTMQEDGILKVLKGLTTLEEVESITGPILW